VLGLPLVGRDTAGALGCILLFGLGFGVGTIARPALLADRYGTNGFATIAGVMTVPLTITKALAPLGAAALHRATGSYTTVAISTAAACATAATLLVLRPRTTRHSISSRSPGPSPSSGGSLTSRFRWSARA
jgi:hypothetical protein